MDIIAHSATLLERERVAREAVAAIPVLPVTSSFLALSPPPTPQALRTAVEGLLGTLILAPPSPPPHVHTPHCDHASGAMSATRAHVHSATCNHTISRKDTVFAAAASGDAPALEAALLSGGSTEEADEVGYHFFTLAAWRF